MNLKPPFTFHLQTLGCQMNIADSQRISSLLKASGGTKIPHQNQADLVIFITCSVRQKGEERVKGQIHTLIKTNPKAIIGLTGCMIHHGNKTLKAMLPGLDFTFDIQDLQTLPALLHLKSPNPKPNLKHFSLPPDIDSDIHAFVPITHGCDNFCSFCIVPFARGREWSRPASEIISEITDLLDQGFPEIFLLGQNVNSFTCPDTKMTFPELLQTLDKLHPDKTWWLRFISPHPKDTSPKLIACFKTLTHLTPWMHLPLQSGSDVILTKMNRKYSVSDFAKLVHDLRKAKPDITISTDVIVGFPGETRADFAKTLQAWHDFQFDISFISQFSPRPGTAAATMPDDVSPSEKKQRWTELNDLQREISKTNLTKLQNQTVEILIEKTAPNWIEGKTAHMVPVRLQAPKNHKIKPGQFVKGTITQTKNWAVEGELL